MTDPRWTEETERAVTTAILGRTAPVGARAALALLAEAELLVAPGSVLEEQWRALVALGGRPMPWHITRDKEEAIRDASVFAEIGAKSTVERRTVTTWPDESVLTGPWLQVEVDLPKFDGMSSAMTTVDLPEASDA